MADDTVSVVEASFRHYLAQDRDSAIVLYADDFSFTSPQDDHIDKAAFFERCFPTVARLSDQRMLSVTPVGDDLVLAYYEYDLRAGGTYRNVEAITVRNGLIAEVQVFFGGATSRG